MSTQHLEDLRDEQPVGTVAFTYGASDLRPLLFHEMAQTAFYVTIDALNRFQASTTIGGNPYVIPTIGLWFLATESYISTVYKVAEIDQELRERADLAVARTLPAKLAAIEKYFGATQTETPRLALIEFCTLRNMVFHDLVGTKNPEFHHTLFAEGARHLNEVDLFQSVIVAIGLFTYLRWLFPATDLMPSLFIQGAQEKLDLLAKEILFPAFKDLLDAKGIATRLALKPSEEVIVAEAPLPLRILIRAEGGPVAPVEIDPTPSVAWHHFQVAAEARPVDDDTFELPRYTR